MKSSVRQLAQLRLGQEGLGHPYEFQVAAGRGDVEGVLWRQATRAQCNCSWVTQVFHYRSPLSTGLKGELGRRPVYQPHPFLIVVGGHKDRLGTWNEFELFVADSP